MYTLQIAEDHQLFTDGLKSMLSEFDEIKVTATSVNGAETFRNLKLDTPDILLLDLNLAETNGVEVIDFIKTNQFKTKIIIISMFYEKSYISMARKRGAHAFVPKNVGKEQMIHTIRKVISEGSFFEPINDYDNLLKRIFTGREIEVLELIKIGYDAQTIGKMLNITYETVRTHRKNLLQKAKANNIIQLFNYTNIHKELD
ncbi:MAG: response regulator [Cytophagales bacterium]